MKTVAYYRNSAKGKQKNSLDIQRTAAKDMAKKLQLLIDEHYEDPDISGRITRIDERLELDKMLQEIEAGEVSTLLVQRRDRLARDVGQYLYIYNILKKHNVNVIFTTEDEIPISYLEGAESLEAVLAARNQVEAERIVLKLTDSRIHKARDGKHAGGKFPFGYQKNEEKPGEYIPINEEIDVIPIIYEQFISGDYKNFEEFRKHLVSMGKFYRGKEWEQQTLKRIIQNPIYKGLKKNKFFGNEVISNKEYPKIVSIEMWEEAQLKLEKFSRPRVNPPIEMCFLLNEILYCQECGKQFSNKKKWENGTGRGYYLCNQHPTFCFEKNELEEKIIEESKSVMEKLLITYSEEIDKRIIKHDQSIYKQYFTANNKALMKIKQSLVEKTDEWLTTDSKKIYDELLELYNEYQKREDAVKFASEKLRVLEETPQRIDELKKKVLLEGHMSDLKENELSKLLKDIIGKINVGSKGFQITFKHPFIKETFPTDIEFIGNSEE